MKDKLIAGLSELLERELTSTEQAIISWTIGQVISENLKLEESLRERFSTESQ